MKYRTPPAIEHLGPITDRPDGWLGLYLHSTKAYDPQGTSLGLLDIQCWARDPQAYGKRHRRHRLPLEQKEAVSNG